MEARWLDNQPLRLLPRHNSDPALCPPPDTATVDLENTTSYLRWLWQYTASMIFVYVRSMRSQFPLSTAWMAWESLKPHPSWILYVPMLIPMGRVLRCCGGGGTKCRQSTPCCIGRLKHMTIFPPCLRFHLRSPWKCAVPPSVEYTSTHVFFGLYAKCSNEVTTCVPLLQSLFTEDDTPGPHRW